jgi:hypothetical protein
MGGYSSNQSDKRFVLRSPQVPGKKTTSQGAFFFVYRKIRCCELHMRGYIRVIKSISGDGI